MPAINRFANRTVHIFDAGDPKKPLGGLILTAGITNANFYSMLEVLFLFSSAFTLQLNDGNTIISRNGDALQQGNYYIITAGPFPLTDEPWLARMVSHSTRTRTIAFRDEVRSRDQGCVISGRRAVDGLWTSFHAAHIFPLAREDYWIEHGFDRWITTEAPHVGGSINNVQNGLLLRRDLHGLFDSYAIAINPDDNYKIVYFVTDQDGLAGTHLDQRYLEIPNRPVDPLLRWHYRQAILANMRGVGEPVFEHDFPPGSDIIGEILEGPMPAQRMEFELYSRLAGIQDA